MERWKAIEPGTWKPKNKGDEVEGVLASKDPKDESVGISARYHLESEDGIKLVWGSTVLDDRMQFVKVGQKVRITYDGQTTNKRNQKVNLYKVEVAENTNTNKQSGENTSDHDEPIDVEQLEAVE